MEDSTIVEEKKRFITFKSIQWFIIWSVVACGYYFMINWLLMDVQGLNFFYLWVSGEG